MTAATVCRLVTVGKHVCVVRRNSAIPIVVTGYVDGNEVYEVTIDSWESQRVNMSLCASNYLFAKSKAIVYCMAQVCDEVEEILGLKTQFDMEKNP